MHEQTPQKSPGVAFDLAEAESSEKLCRLRSKFGSEPQKAADPLLNRLQPLKPKPQLTRHNSDHFESSRHHTRRKRCFLIRCDELSHLQQHHDERIRTMCLALVAVAVAYAALVTLRSILVPFFLAVAIKYLLTPLINWLSCHPDGCTGGCLGGCRLPRPLAILVAVLIGVGMVLLLALLIVQGVTVFTHNVDVYNERLNVLLSHVLEVVDELSQMGKGKGDGTDAADGASGVYLDAGAAAGSASTATQGNMLDEMGSEVHSGIAELQAASAATFLIMGATLITSARRVLVSASRI